MYLSIVDLLSPSEITAAQVQELVDEQGHAAPRRLRPAGPPAQPPLPPVLVDVIARMTRAGMTSLAIADRLSAVEWAAGMRVTHSTVRQARRITAGSKCIPQQWVSTMQSAG